MQRKHKQDQRSCRTLASCTSVSSYADAMFMSALASVISMRLMVDEKKGHSSIMLRSSACFFGIIADSASPTPSLQLAAILSARGQFQRACSASTSLPGS